VAVIALVGFAEFARREFKLARDSRGRLGGAIATIGFLVAALIIAYGALN